MVGIRVEVWGQAGGKGVKGNEEERVMPEGGLTKVGLGAVNSSQSQRKLFYFVTSSVYLWLALSLFFVCPGSPRLLWVAWW